MPGLPRPRRQIAGVSLLALLIVLGLLYALRRIPPRSPLDGRETPPAGTAEQSR